MTEPSELIIICNSMRANILMASPSVLRQLLPLQPQFKKPLRRIITYAEVLDPLEKARFATAFRAPIVEIYQASEGQIASPCRHGNLHINEDLVYVELLNQNGSPIQAGQRAHRMLVTNLVNTVQPLLRYEMNDIIELGSPCPCGSHFRVIRQVIGRNDDVLQLRTRAGRIRPVFPDLFSRWIITTDDRIREFVVEQDDPDHLMILLDLNGVDGQTAPAKAETYRKENQENNQNFDETETLKIVIRLRERLDQELSVFDIECNINIQIQHIQLPLNNHKFKRFNCRMPKSF